MKLSKSGLIGLVVFTGSCLLLGLGWQAIADSPRCYGVQCVDKNPMAYGCDRDAVVVDKISPTPVIGQAFGQKSRIVVQKMYSQSCNANWVKAYVPNATYLFIREQRPVNGIEPIHGMAKAVGNSYFWFNSNMSAAGVINQACASLSTGAWFWYDRHCTSFNLFNSQL